MERKHLSHTGPRIEPGVTDLGMTERGNDVLRAMSEEGTVVCFPGSGADEDELDIHDIGACGACDQ